MEFGKTVGTILYAGQPRRQRHKEQGFRLSGQRRGWDDLREKHWNMYITMCKIDDQYKFHAWSRSAKAGALGQPRGIRWGGRWEPPVQDGRTHVSPTGYSYWYVANRITIPLTNYSPIKLMIKKKRIHPPMQRACVRSLVQEDCMCCRATNPVCHNYWTRLLQLLKPTSLDPVLHKKRSICN